MTVEEHRTWQKIRTKMFRTRDRLDGAMAERSMIVMLSKFCTDNGYYINALKDISSTEEDLLNAKSEIDKLTNAVNDAEMGYLGIVYNNGDFDIVTPSTESVSGFGFPPIVAIGIGVVSVVAIFARWVYLEHKVEEISNDMNEILTDANKELCADPDSSMCKDWKKRRTEKDYKEQETLSQTVKRAVGAAGKGLEIGLIIALPLLAYTHFGRKQ